jgi:hypothetical protein
MRISSRFRHAKGIREPSVRASVNVLGALGIVIIIKCKYQLPQANLTLETIGVNSPSLDTSLTPIHTKSLQVQAQNEWFSPLSIG